MSRAGLSKIDRMQITILLCCENILTMPLPVWTILVVDHEPVPRKKLCGFLAVGGHNVEEAGDINDAMDRILRSNLQFVLLDLDIPGIDATSICRMIRSISPHIGLLLFSMCNSEQHRVAAFEAGADCYLAKPLGLYELMARFHAIHRRVPTRSEESIMLHAGELQMDLHGHSVRRAGEELHLNPKEFELLAVLMKHQDSTVAHATLLRTIWGPPYVNESDYLKSYIKTLRKKIEVDPANPKYILTEPRAGYRFCTPVTDSPASEISTNESFL